MTLTSFPFEGQTTSETQFSYLFRELASSGVCASADSDAFRVTASSSNLVANIAAGHAIVRGFMAINDGIVPVSFDSVTSGQRIDTVVLRLDPALDSIVLAVIKGSAVAAPTLTQTDSGIFELPLADVTVLASGALNVVERRRFSSQGATVWTTDTRPTSPRQGALGYNTTLKLWEFWDGTTWATLLPQDSGWQQLVMSGNFPLVTAYVRKVGNHVYFRAHGGLTINDYATRTFCELPAIYQPPMPIRHFAPREGQSTASGLWIYVLPSNGSHAMQVARIGPDSSQAIDIFGNLSWLVD